MQTSTPLTTPVARKIALRQGLLLGTFAGCLALLSTACVRFVPVSTYSFNLIYILAFIAFFVAGWRTGKKTSRIDMGALAGFWAGVAVAIFAMATLVVLAVIEYLSVRSLGLSSIAYVVSGAVTPVLLALLFGAAVGALGARIGKIYAENPAAQPASTPPTAMSAPQPFPPGQPVQPASPPVISPPTPVQPPSQQDQV